MTEPKKEHRIPLANLTMHRFHNGSDWLLQPGGGKNSPHWSRYYRIVPEHSSSSHLSVRQGTLRICLFVFVAFLISQLCKTEASQEEKRKQPGESGRIRANPGELGNNLDHSNPQSASPSWFTGPTPYYQAGSIMCRCWDDPGFKIYRIDTFCYISLYYLLAYWHV